MIDKRVEIIEKDGVNYERTSYIEVNEDGTEVVRGVVETPVQTEPVEPEPTSDPIMEKLDSIEAKIQTNEDLQNFYDEIVEEVGL